MPTSVTPSIGDITGDRGVFYPRWLLLAFLILTPLVVLTYSARFMSVFTGDACPLGTCTFDALPGVFQVGLLWLMFVVLWMFAFLFGLDCWLTWICWPF